MQFTQAAEVYKRLKSQLDGGQITPEAFEAAVNDLQVTDHLGRSWMIGVESGHWYRLEGETWVEDTPPVTSPPDIKPSPPPAAPRPPPREVPPSSRKKSWLLWVLGGLVVLCLAAAGILVLTMGVGGLTSFLSNRAEASLIVETPAILENTPGVSSQVKSTPTPVATEGSSETLPAASPQPPATATGAAPSPGRGELSAGGPWVILPASNGIWAMNPDGSGLKQIVNEPILGPENLLHGRQPGGENIAYITAADVQNLRGLALKMVDIKTGKIETLTRLTTDQTEPPANPEVCDPVYEAARAATIGDGVTWSPDGKDLAFVGVLEDKTSDVYRLNLESRKITRLTGGASQAFDVHWSKGGWIVHFGASCFGTGAGFAMMGAWATRYDNRDTVDLYSPDPTAMYEKFLDWVNSEIDAFSVATVSGCPYRDLRMVEVETGKVTPIFNGCMDDLVEGPLGTFAVLAGESSKQPQGVYNFQEPFLDNVMPPVFTPVSDARRLRLGPNLDILVEIRGAAGPKYISIDSKGQPGAFSGDGSLPWINPATNDEWVVERGGAFYLEGKDRQPVELFKGEVAYPDWYDDTDSKGNSTQYLLFYTRAPQSDDYSLMLAAGPEYKPVEIGRGISPTDSYFWVFKH